MKEIKDSEGGWMHYIGEVKKGLTVEVDEPIVKLIMKCYIDGKPHSQAITEVNSAN